MNTLLDKIYIRIAMARPCSVHDIKIVFLQSCVTFKEISNNRPMSIFQLG